jgi:hypothetical protein
LRSFEGANDANSCKKFVLRPTFTPAQIKALDKQANYAYDLNNKKYLPGMCRKV